MKKFILSISILLLIVVANAQQNKTEIASKLKAMEVAWNNASMSKDHGIKVKSEIIADDFYGMGDNNKLLNKQELIKSEAEAFDVTTNVVNGEMYVHFFGDNVATVVGSHVTKGKGKDGKAFTKHFSWTDTYMQRNGKWQCIGSGVNQKNE